MKKHNLAFIDLETTGLDPNKHEIIEIGCIVARQVSQNGQGCTLEKIEEFEIRVKPEHLETAEPEALRINGYNETDWVFASDLAQALKTLSDKTEGAMMIAHNLTFDWSFLEKAFAKTGVLNKMDFHRIDLLSVAFARLYHETKVDKFSLRALTEYFGLTNERAHTALADIRVSFEVYKKLLGLS